MASPGAASVALPPSGGVGDSAVAGGEPGNALGWASWARREPGTRPLWDR